MASKKDITVDKGATFELQIIYKDAQSVVVDLTGYTARGQVRSNANSADKVAEFTCTIPTPTNGTVICTIPADKTELIPTTGATYADKDTYYYDIELVNGAEVIRLINGVCYVSPVITKITL